MPKKRVLSPPSVWDIDSLTSAFESAGVNASYHIPKLYSYLIRHPEQTDFSDLGTLAITFPKAAQAILVSDFVRSSSKLLHSQRSSDGETVKLLIQLQDGLQVESVIMTYDTRDRYGVDTGRRRATLCVSSEVGCQMGCTFCATGTMGLTADLTSAEIIEQLVHANNISPVSNVVFMGMGEPLNNWVAVRTAVSMMVDNRVFSLRKSAVTVSTVGVIPRILNLADELKGVSLALSLHAPTQELRQQIVPSAKAYKLDKLMAAIDTYIAKTGQKVFIEYVMLGPDVNCTAEHARQLGELLKGKEKQVVVNLIPWNPILSPGMEFGAPAPGAVGNFHKILKEEFDIPSTVRQEKGQDVSAACGQLVLEHGGKACSSTGAGIADVEDLGSKRAVAACGKA